MPETEDVSRDEVTQDLRRVGSHPDAWYPLARSKQLARGKTLAVSFAGEPIVLVRPEAGELYALEDRCAHRQVPLSEGTVCGERLRCCYHGWFFDAAGTVKIPYPHDPRLAPKRIRTFPCREAYGLIFVYPGDPARLEQAAFPQLDRHADPRYKTRYLDRRVGCHYSFLHENLMDMNHQFLHGKLMGGIRTQHLATRTEGGVVEVDYTFARVSGRGTLGEKFMLGRRKTPTEDRAQDVMTVATVYPYQTLSFSPMGSSEPVLDLWICYTPVDREQRVNHTFGLMMIRRPRVPLLMEMLWPFVVWFTEGIFREDRWIVEQEQRAFDAQGADQNREVYPVILELRKLLRARGVPLGGPASGVAGEGCTSCADVEAKPAPALQRPG